jgi:hypothetical protein
MRRETVKIIAFIAVLIAIVFAVDRLLMQGLRSSATDTFGYWNRLVQGKLTADILVTGSSRALVHFDCDRIAAVTGRSCRNIGMDGTRFDLQAPLLQTYLKYNPPPEIIVQEIDINALSRRDGLFKPERFVPYLGEKEIYRKLCLLDPAFRLHKYVPLYSFGKFGMKLTMPALAGWGDKLKGADMRWNGYLPQDKAWGSDFDKFRNANPDGLAYPIEESEAKDLEDMITAAKNRNIAMILVYAPEYYENCRLTKNRREIFAAYRAIADKYGVPFWDYSDIPLTREKEYFYNSQHLNRLGATLFSEQFAARLKSYLETRRRNPPPDTTVKP